MKNYQVYIDILDESTGEVLNVECPIVAAKNAEDAQEKINEEMRKSHHTSYYIWEILESDSISLGP